MNEAASGTSVGFTVADLARCAKGEVVGASDIAIRGLETVQAAEPGELTFIGDQKHATAWATSRASAAIVSRKLAGQVSAGDGRAIIVVPDADVAMIAILELFAQPEVQPAVGVHPTAFVDPSAIIGAGVRIGPHVSIGPRSRIGAGSVLHAGVRIYDDVSIGDGCVLHANVTVRERCVLGRSVVLHGGVQIGTDGFGYRPAPDGRGLLKVPHIGNVVLGDAVEIGANSCVDRGKFGATLVGAGTKIDNLVQVGHNCRIGRSCVISGLVGIAGSTIVGDGTLIGGGAGLSDHITIGKGVRIGARSGVMNDIPDGETWVGFPAKERRVAIKEELAGRKLPEYLKNLKHILGPDAAKILERGPDETTATSDAKA
ncbi:MAG: UDP-3-O-(3-hydroxymyristoyl)glucosamine N-acyltransferase [Phycisphaerales bacterium]